MIKVYRQPPQAFPTESAFFRLPGTLLMVLDEDWVVQMMSDAWIDVLGQGQEQLRWRSFGGLIHEDDRRDVIDRLSSITEERSTLRFSCRCRHANGNFIGLAWSVTLDAEHRLYYVSAHETGVLLRSNADNLPEVLIDGLTGLPNRGLFVDRIGHAIHRAQRNDRQRFAVIHCGIDRFSVINHSLGNRVGDLLLIELANLLRRATRPTDMVARLGGDEFGILLDDIRDVTSPIRVIQRLQSLCAQPFQLHGQEVTASLSAGMTLSGDEYDEADAMLRDAGMALKRAKTQGGGAHVIFDRKMHEEAFSHLDLELDLRRALERGQIEVYYQPIVRLRDRRLICFEALARWNHPERGLISPARFIPLAEESGLIVPIGRWILSKACSDLRRWQLAYPRRPALTVSVNLSARQIRHSDLIKDVRQSLRDSGLAARHLKLEITESAMMDDAERAIELFIALKRSRLKLMLDDFGTGYSSLSYLHRLPIDALKIDRSFIEHIDKKKTDCSFVETILSLARQLELDVVCEGVERIEQEGLLRQLGAGHVQGFLYSRPVTAAQAEMLIVQDLHSPGCLLSEACPDADAHASPGLIAQA